MHLGNVFSALLSWLSVKSKGGKWLLRIEDIDPGRSRQAYADLLMKEAKVWVNPGTMYGPQSGEGYIRLNMACPRTLQMEALRRVAENVH